MLTKFIQQIRERMAKPTSQRIDRLSQTQTFMPKPLGGATPIHYRAFNLLQARLQENDTFFDGAHPDIVAFRERTKKVKEQTDQLVLGAAHRLLDNYVDLVEAFVPAWNSADDNGELELYEIGKGDRSRLRDSMLRTVRLLDAELAEILAASPATSDQFDVMQRYYEIRYQGGDESLLSPIHSH